MRQRKKTGGMKSQGGSSGRDRTLQNTAQETTGGAAGVSSGYGMPKGPAQTMAGAAKKGAGKLRK